MSDWRDLMHLVGFGVDDDGEVWMWTDDPASVRWRVTVRQEWEGIETRETPRRIGDLSLDTFELVEWGEEGDRSIEAGGSVYPLSAWPVDREHLIAIEIDFGDGTSERYP